MRDRFMQFMRGRYGQDQLGRAMSLLVLVLVVLGVVCRRQVFFYVALALLIVSDFRILSRNIARRSEENRRYLIITSRMRNRYAAFKKNLSDRRYNHIYRCPNCRQKIRIPKGKGNIVITCPRCHIEFRKKS